MKTTIGKFDPVSRSVTVIFDHQGVVHRRAVNAVLKPDGSCDKVATRLRVEEVAIGVAAKIEMGAIQPPTMAAPTEDPA